MFCLFLIFIFTVFMLSWNSPIIRILQCVCVLFNVQGPTIIAYFKLHSKFYPCENFTSTSLCIFCDFTVYKGHSDRYNLVSIYLRNIQFKNLTSLIIKNVCLHHHLLNFLFTNWQCISLKTFPSPWSSSRLPYLSKSAPNYPF